MYNMYKESFDNVKVYTIKQIMHNKLCRSKHYNKKTTPQVFCHILLLKETVRRDARRISSGINQ